MEPITAYIYIATAVGTYTIVKTVAKIITSPFRRGEQQTTPTEHVYKIVDDKQYKVNGKQAEKYLKMLEEQKAITNGMHDVTSKWHVKKPTKLVK